MDKIEVEKWTRGDDEKNLDIEILEANEIIANVTGQNQNSNDENEPIQKISCKEAVMSFNSCLQWAAKNALPLHEVIFLRRIRQKAVDLSIKKCVQSTLDNFVQRTIKRQ
ncbi:unnamed protein product [Psylliodes chrysocephalus]|uniref:Uncharacterized protein n=1 Tax=Psylliodes chrysocephalus TaxID=3402493 RepID=A0A9P0CQ47_9CUCU|nr:unnamed protein product [Psylliodes chrysocephala]